METSSLNIKQSILELHNYEIQFAAIFGGMILLFLIEGLIPRRTTELSQTNRWLSNISLAIFNHFFIFFYSIVLISLVAKFQPQSPLLQAFKVSDILSFIIVLFVLECVNYWTHRAFHHFPILWRVHLAHHTDTEIDVTTSHRHHPIEPMITAIVGIPVVFILGAPVISLILYGLLHTAVNLFSHSNIIIPEKWDKYLRLFIVTPDFHRLHHSSDVTYTDSNYSVILPWFDYLFKTATQKPYQEIPNMELGLETFRETKDNRLDKLLITPFIYK